MNLDAKIVIPPGVASTSVENGAVLVNLETGKYYALRDVGLRFWELLKEGRQPRECLPMLLDEYDVSPQTLESDLLILMRELADNGLIVPSPI